MDLQISDVQNGIGTIKFVYNVHKDGWWEEMENVSPSLMTVLASIKQEIVLDATKDTLYKMESVQLTKSQLPST